MLLWLGLAALAGPARAADDGDTGVRTARWLQCERTAGAMECRSVAFRDLDLVAPVTTLATTVEISPDRPPDAPPLMVQVVAMASSEIYWNGVLIGRNGRVGVDAAHESPGAFRHIFIVPAGLAKPGQNTVALRLSSHHLWLPIRHPFHRVIVTPYVDPLLEALHHYLPALLVMGVLLLAAIYFGGAALLDRSATGSALLCAIAVAGMAQLVAETARMFITYPYPWQPVRLAMIAGLAGLTAVLIAAFVSRRFAPGRWRMVTTATAILVLAILVLVPTYDSKALYAFASGALAMAGCGVAGVRRGVRTAWLTVAVGLLVLGLALTPSVPFLDAGYYIALAAVLSALVASQALSLRDARRDREAADARAEAALRAMLARGPAKTPSQAAVQVRDGRRVHHVASGDLLFLKAADDYCEAHLADGRRLLWTTTLAAALAELPEGFVRIHKSYAVNRARIASIGRDGSGRLKATLDAGAAIPIGRAYAGALS